MLAAEESRGLASGLAHPCASAHGNGMLLPSDDKLLRHLIPAGPHGYSR
jgi:hypothetical protein